MPAPAGAQATGPSALDENPFMTERASTLLPSSMPFPPGTVLVGKYRVERLLGEGGMGWVVVATHLQLEQQVALKFMHAEHAARSPTPSRASCARRAPRRGSRASTSRGCPTSGRSTTARRTS